MSNYLIDRVEDIAARLKEIEADKDLARTGSSAPVTGKDLGEYAHGWPLSPFVPGTPVDDYL